MPSQGKRWYKLDNAAKVYPPTKTRTRSPLFRLSVTLTEPVDEAILEQALTHAMHRFPTFATHLKHGFFWYYMEHADGIPPIDHDVRNPMMYLDFKKNNGFLFRVRCYGRRIAIEIFHSVADATGGITFLMSLTAEYLRLRYGVTISPGNYVKDLNEPPKPTETEDSFLRFCRKERLSRSESPAYHLPYTPLENNDVLLISGKVDTAALLQKAKDYHVTLGVFLTSLLMQAAINVQKNDPRKNKTRYPVKVSVPINLRKFYPAETLRNFSSYVNPGIDTRLGEYTFEEILDQIHHFMGLNVTEKKLNGVITENVATEKMPIVRILPLFLKVPVIKMFYLMQGDRYNTTSISNLGKIQLPSEMDPFVERIDFILGVPFDYRTNCACISYKENTIFNFTRTTKEAEVERYFFTSLVEMGIPVYLESNGREN